MKYETDKWQHLLQGKIVADTATIYGIYVLIQWDKVEGVLTKEEKLILNTLIGKLQEAQGGR